MNAPDGNVTPAAVENNQMIRAGSLGESATAEAQVMPLASGEDEASHDCVVHSSADVKKRNDSNDPTQVYDLLPLSKNVGLLTLLDHSLRCTLCNVRCATRPDVRDVEVDPNPHDGPR
jgi:hypothetical protein